MPTGGAPARLAYLVFAHHETAHLARLCGRLLDGDPHCRVVLHFDSHRSGATLPTTLGDPRLAVLPRPVCVEWGDWSQVEAFLSAMRWVSKLDVDWVLTISGQCYPLRPPAEIAALLGDAAFDFVSGGAEMGTEVMVVTDPDREHRRRPSEEQQRYYYRYSRLPWSVSAALRRRRISWAATRLARYSGRRSPNVTLYAAPSWPRTRLGLRRRRLPYGHDLTCHKGSQWLAASKPVVADLLAFLDRRPDYVEHYRTSVIPDESFFLTLLHSWTGLRRAADVRLHFTEFLQWAHHPSTLRPEHFEHLVSSGALFARKFDAGSAPLLDRIDAELLDTKVAT